MFRRHLLLSLSFHLLVILGVGVCLPSSTPGVKKPIELKLSLSQSQVAVGVVNKEDPTNFGREKTRSRVEEARKEKPGEEHTRDKGSGTEENTIPVEVRSSLVAENINGEESLALSTKQSHSAQQSILIQQSVDVERSAEEEEETSYATEAKQKKELTEEIKKDDEKKQAKQESTKFAPPEEESPQPLPQPQAKNHAGKKEKSLEEENNTLLKESASVEERGEEPDQLPVLVNQEEPFYPLLARRRGWEGTVVLVARLKKDGKVAEVNVVESSGYKVLDQEAVKVIGEWVYKPAYNDGSPIEYRLKVKITFDLEHDAVQN